MLLSGDIDFAVVDEFTMDKSIEISRVYDEVLGLYIHKDLLKKHSPVKNSKKFYEGLSYVEYQEGAPVLRMWFGHHLGTHNLKLDVKATVVDVQSVARLILSGIGAGILPWHHLSQLSKEANSLYCLEASGKVLKNQISVASLRERTHSPATLSAMDFLKEHLIKVEKGRGI